MATGCVYMCMYVCKVCICVLMHVRVYCVCVVGRYRIASNAYGIFDKNGNVLRPLSSAYAMHNQAPNFTRSCADNAEDAASWLEASCRAITSSRIVLHHYQLCLVVYTSSLHASTYV